MHCKKISVFSSIALLLVLLFTAAPTEAQYNAFKDPSASGIAASLAGAPDFKAVSEAIQGGKIAVGATSFVVILFKNQGSALVTVGKVSLYPSSNVSAEVALNQCADAPLASEAQCAITVSVKGLVPGSWRVDALIDHDGRSRLATASMRSEVEPGTTQKDETKGDVGIFPVGLDFGTSPGGIAQVRPVTLKNLTASSVKIKSITLDGPDKSGFSYKSQCPESLQPEESCNVIVTWQPTSKGLAQGVLVVQHSGKSGMVQEEIKGVLQPPPAEAVAKEESGSIELSPAVLDFGTSAGGIALKRSVVLSNHSAEDAEIWDVGMDIPDQSGFSYDAQCPETLRPGESCNVVVTWQPTSKGLAQGVLTVQHSGKSGMVQTEVKGTLQPTADGDKAGMNGKVGVTPESMDFGTSGGGIPQVRPILVSNHLSEPIKIQNILLNAPEQSGFSYKSQCPETLLPEGMCNIIVSWQPTSKGLAQGVLAIQHSGKGGLVQTELKGIFQPAADDIAKVAAGKVDIAPEVMDFGTSDGGISLVRSAVMTNNSADDIEIWDVDMDVPDRSGFSYDSQCPDTLRSGETCNIIVTWQPTSKGLAQGLLVVQHSGKSGMSRTEVKGIYQPPAESSSKDVDGRVQAMPESLDFGNSLGGISAVRSIILTNNSETPVDIKGTILDVPEQSGFSYKSECPQTLQPGGACNIFVNWLPTSKGVAQGVLVVQHTGKSGMTQIDIKGSLQPEAGKTAAIYPEVVPDRGLLVSDKEKIEFGDNIKQESAITMTLVNSGSSALTLKGIKLSGVENDLDLSDTGCVPETVLKPGEACPLTISWFPSHAGTILDSLQITHTGARGVLVIPVSGSADKSMGNDSAGNGGTSADKNNAITGEAGTGSSASGSSAPIIKSIASKSMSQIFSGYTVSSHSTSRAVVNGPDGGLVVRDGEDIFIEGIKCTVAIVPTGVILSTKDDKAILHFDGSLNSSRLLNQATSSAGSTASSSQSPPAPAAIGASLLPPNLTAPAVH